jgi:hypothetical protein
LANASILSGELEMGTRGKIVKGKAKDRDTLADDEEIDGSPIPAYCHSDDGRDDGKEPRGGPSDHRGNVESGEALHDDLASKCAC